MFHPSTFDHLSPRRAPRPRTAADDAAVLIRRASAYDEPALARLAALDERPELPPAGERLIGELGGRIVAALDVRSGRAVADPFVPTSRVVELLGLRAAQVRR
ncbi:MAG TPA: hypothetical protein VGV67_10595 [Solirubrobacteraceae bacterium]|nr:hypothetical protein [Solirubrobacteraceae bacterium]